MSFLPRGHPRLGQLELDEVFDWFDGPVLFSVRNELRYRFLAFAADTDAYAYVPVSEQRLAAVKTGLVTVRKAFEAPETGFVFLYRFREGVEELQTDDLPMEWLPDDTWRLSEPTATAVPFDADDLASLAGIQGRPLVALKLETPTMLRTEFPARHMANVLYEFQELATAATVDTVKAKSTNQDVVKDAELSTVYLAAASFVVVLAPAQHSDRLMAAPTATLDSVASLIEATSAGGDAFIEYVTPFSRRTRAHLRNLLQNLIEAESDLSLFSADPSGQLRHTVLPVNTASDRVEVLLSRTDLPSKEITWNAYLLAVDHTRLSLKVKEAAPSGRRKRRRTRRASFEPAQRHLFTETGTGDQDQGGPIYRVHLREDTQISEFDDVKGSKSYALLDLEPVETPVPVLDTTSADS